jgi:hypothetical protein
MFKWQAYKDAICLLGYCDRSLARMELLAVNLQCMVWRKQDGIANPGIAKALA